MNIVLDCERMKYPNTGLYTFCDKLSISMQKVINGTDHLSFFIYPKSGSFRGDNATYIKRQIYNKLLPVYVHNLDIWHTTYQLSKFRGGDIHTKNVLTVHDLNFLYEDSSLKDKTNAIKKHQQRIDRADHIVAISEFTKKDILEHLDIKGKPLSVIHNGASIIEYTDFEEPRYKPERKFIFSLGTIIPKKNFHVLPALLKNNDYELIIAGIPSSYSDRIKEEAKKHGVKDRVKIVGAISGEEKYWYLKNCLAFAFPSLAEGFGIPVVEAMSFGKPVFLSTHTSLPEIGGEYAYYFDDFDAESMQNIFDKNMSSFFEKDLSEAIRAHAAKFNWDECARSYYKVYQSLLK
ncbi:glycosyltransferase family 4 protein [Dysgonomonas sp. ZJ279]|uniref:glycosyltransferase family 4 protein n=1 Tax=Dysgonomonas sp. ZJ279 TaxID=2709796 RepID=UPI0013ED1526|nr:glycosyltransferase family 1 protein [Dysgonomonas sp. ZJ279]